VPVATHPLRLAALALAFVVSGCAGGGPSAAYCDAVSVLQASVDPLADPNVRSDPAQLEAAFQSLVQSYGRLARLAPDDVRSEAAAARDGVIRVSNALAVVGWEAGRANESGELSAALDDPAYAEALVELRRYNLRECGIG
jgi:hypothetical protein